MNIADDPTPWPLAVFVSKEIHKGTPRWKMLFDRSTAPVDADAGLQLGNCDDLAKGQALVSYFFLAQVLCTFAGMDSNLPAITGRPCSVLNELESPAIRMRVAD